LLGPHVDDAGDEGLDDTELGVDADGDQHEEEHHRPDRPSWQLQHHLRIGDKYEAWARIDNLQGKVLGDAVMQYDDAT